MSMGKDNENPQQCRLDMLLSHQLQGVICCAQKCQPKHTPENYRGPTEQRRNAKILPPPTVLEPERKCSNAKNVPLQGKGSTSRRRLCQPNVNPSRTIYRGAIEATQKCHRVCAPTSFIWCRDYLAEMPLLTRTKGRAKILLQKCHVTNALPNQLKGSL